MAETNQRISVVGAGTMGHGIAQVFARSGDPVVLVDIKEEMLEKAQEGIESSLERFVDKGKIERQEKENVLDRITFTTEIEETAGSALAVEAVPEKFEIKADTLQSLSEQLDDDAILASNTSSISITKLGASTDRPAKIAGMHFFNPVPMMDLVEVVQGEETSDDTVRQIQEYTEELNKTPVVAEDFPGFVSNRILMPMLNEAFFAYMEGVADREGIDEIMKLGMGHPMGPLQLADMIGLDVCLHILEVLHEELGEDKYRPCPLLRRKVNAGHLGKKSGQGFYSYEN